MTTLDVRRSPTRSTAPHADRAVAEAAPKAPRAPSAARPTGFAPGDRFDLDRGTTGSAGAPAARRDRTAPALAAPTRAPTGDRARFVDDGRAITFLRPPLDLEPLDPKPLDPRPQPVDVEPISSPEDAQERLEALEKKGPPPRSDYPEGWWGDVLHGWGGLVHRGDVSRAEKDVEYQALKQSKPERSAYPDDAAYEKAVGEYDARTAPYQDALKGEYLQRYQDEVMSKTPTGRALLAEAERLGVPITVLSDEEYKKKYPGTAGVTDGGHVYVPVSSLEDTTNGALEHELGHAIIGREPGLFDPSRPLEERTAQARALFERMGLDPRQGENLARVTQGWSDPIGTADHVQTYVTTTQLAREQAGLPPLSDAQLAALYDGASAREAALYVKRDLDGGQITLEEAERRWAEFPQGQAHPPSGATEAERRASLDAILARLSDEAPLKAYETVLPN